MNGAYLALTGRIRLELPQMARLVERVSHAWEQSKHSSDDYYIDAVALNLHSFYTSAEHVFEAIADTVDQTRPSHAAWHQELLRQMEIEIPGVRPPVLCAETREALVGYCLFQHTVRNSNPYLLDPMEIGLLVDRLPHTMDLLSHDLHAFADLLEALGSGGGL
jgi:hypothetical protein